MTEPSRASTESDPVGDARSAVVAASQREHDAYRASLDAFDASWRIVGGEEEGVWARLNPHLGAGRTVSIELSDHVEYNLRLNDRYNAFFTQRDQNLENPKLIDLDTAAQEIGHSRSELYNAMSRLRDAAEAAAPSMVIYVNARNELHLAAADLERAASEQALSGEAGVTRDDVTAGQSADVPEWAIDSEDQSITPERVLSDWVQSQTMVDTYLQTDRPDLARQWIEELDENLEAFAEGGAPPGSDEMASVYHDAVARAAIPYGEAPISVDEVRQQLENIGVRVPEINESIIRENAGLMPLNRTMVTNALDQSAPGLPAGLEDVAAARLSVRRAIASITEDSEAAQTHLTAANSALTQAVDTLRPDEARAGMLAAQESVQQASEKVSAVADTAAAVDAEVTLYTTPECVGCAATKRALDKAGVEYEEIPLQEHPQLVQQFKKQGLAQAPIVETKDGERWAGYNPQKLREHGLDYRSRQQRSGESGKDTGHGR